MSTADRIPELRIYPSYHIAVCEAKEYFREKEPDVVRARIGRAEANFVETKETTVFFLEERYAGEFWTRGREYYLWGTLCRSGCPLEE